MPVGEFSKGCIDPDLGSYLSPSAMVCAMIFELVKNKQLTGSVIATKPV